MKASAIFLSVAMATSALANPAKRHRCGGHGPVSTPGAGSVTSSATSEQLVTATEVSTVVVSQTQTATQTVDVTATETITITVTSTPAAYLEPTPVGFTPINPTIIISPMKRRNIRSGVLLLARQNSTVPITSLPPLPSASHAAATTLTRLTTAFEQTTTTVTATRTVATTTLTETVIEWAPTPTVYAVCSPDNFLSEIGGLPIGQVTNFGTDSIMLPADSAVDCCSACMKASDCAISYFEESDGTCYGATLSAADACDAAAHIADANNDVNQDNADIHYTISNGKCGQWTLVDNRQP